MKAEFEGSKESRTLMKLKKNQLCVICDGDESKKELGTGFSFMKIDWIVTAAHVVLVDGFPRQNLHIEFVPGTGDFQYIKVKVLAVHIECDIAILQIENSDYFGTPLYPGNEDLSSNRGLIYAGYNPSENSIRIEHALKFSRDARYRNHEEVILEFESSHVTGGFSGGPIFGDGGVVLGILINQFSDIAEPQKYFARGISIKTLMEGISVQIIPEIMKPIMIDET